MSLVEKARAFAAERHGDQSYGPLEPGGDPVPYLWHLEDVARVVSVCGPVSQAVALLHDVLEDTDTTEAELDHFFGTTVAHSVSICSDEPGRNRKERKRKTNRKLFAVDPPWIEALVVKVADRFCNIRAAAQSRPDLLKMYRREHADFRVAARRPGWADALWEEMDRILENVPSEAAGRCKLRAKFGIPPVSPDPVPLHEVTSALPLMSDDELEAFEDEVREAASLMGYARGNLESFLGAARYEIHRRSDALDEKFNLDPPKPQRGRTDRA